MLLQGFGVPLEVRSDDVRADDVLHVLGELLQQEVVVDLLHFSDGGGDLGLAEDPVEERVLEDAAQEGHVPQAGAEAVPRGALGLGDDEAGLHLGRRGRGRGVLGRGAAARSRAFSRSLLGRLLGRLLVRRARGLRCRGGVPRLLPLLRPLPLPVLVTDVGEHLGGGVDDASEEALGLAGDLGGALRALPHEVLGLLQGLAALRGLVELRGPLPGLALQPAEDLGGLGGHARELLAELT
mmetsp:Transcript_37674/g.107062  ORF Transcript_37674/g.107062 Transcript_37674/m.107062 type:complete len:239 (+) Transcript_37674:709-1425(+)